MFVCLMWMTQHLVKSANLHIVQLHDTSMQQKTHTMWLVNRDK